MAVSIKKQIEKTIGDVKDAIDGADAEKDALETVKYDLVAIELTFLERLHAVGRVWEKGKKYLVETAIAKDLLKLVDNDKPLFARWRDKVETVVKDVEDAITVRAPAPVVDNRPQATITADGKMEIGTPEEEAALFADVDKADEPETPAAPASDDVVKL